MVSCVAQGADLLRGTALIYGNSSSQVLDGGADRLEEGDLLRCLPSGNGATRELEEIAEDGFLADDARLQRLHDVTGFRKGAGAGVDEDTGAAHDRIIG